jgi:hypothetical protein
VAPRPSQPANDNNQASRKTILRKPLIWSLLTDDAYASGHTPPLRLIRRPQTTQRRIGPALIRPRGVRQVSSAYGGRWGRGNGGMRRLGELQRTHGARRLGGLGPHHSVQRDRVRAYSSCRPRAERDHSYLEQVDVAPTGGGTSELAASSLGGGLDPSLTCCIIPGGGPAPPLTCSTIPRGGSGQK